MSQTLSEADTRVHWTSLPRPGFQLTLVSSNLCITICFAALLNLTYPVLDCVSMCARPERRFRRPVCRLAGVDPPIHNRARRFRYAKGFGIVRHVFGEDSVLNVANGLAGMVFYAVSLALSTSRRYDERYWTNTADDGTATKAVVAVAPASVVRQ